MDMKYHQIATPGFMVFEGIISITAIVLSHNQWNCPERRYWIFPVHLRAFCSSKFLSSRSCVNKYLFTTGYCATCLFGHLHMRSGSSCDWLDFTWYRMMFKAHVAHCTQPCLVQIWDIDRSSRSANGSDVSSSALEQYHVWEDSRQVTDRLFETRIVATLYWLDQ